MSRRYVSLKERYKLRLIRGHEGLSKAKSDKLLDSLNSLTCKAVIPYKIVRYEAIQRSGQEQDNLYVLACYFINLDEYDIGIYVPEQRFDENRKGACWQRASDLAHDEKGRLEREGKNFSFSTDIRPFIGIPSPPVEGLMFSRDNWYAMIKFAWKVKRAQEKYSK